MLFGAHESVAGGLHLAFERITKVSGDALQIFTRNQRQWNPKPLAGEEVDNFRKGWLAASGMPVFSHGSYLINLASAKEDVLAKPHHQYQEHHTAQALKPLPELILQAHPL